jgi:hypothetical protein
MCPDAVIRYKIIVILDAAIEVLLVIMPIYYCWKLLTSLPIRIRVIAVFAFRLPVAAIAVVYLNTWEASLNGENPGVDCAIPIVLQQCQLLTSLMAGTIPCLKSFLRSFDTGSGAKATVGSSNKRDSGNPRTRESTNSPGIKDSHQATHP